MKSYVIDASVVTKCFIIEDYSDKATETINAHIKGHISLSAPSLIIYELGNVFWKHPQVNPEKAYMYIKKFLDLQIKLIDIQSNNKILKTTFQISENRSVTFYDASYLALAKESKTKLITADEPLHKKAPSSTLLLKDFKI